MMDEFLWEYKCKTWHKSSDEEYNIDPTLQRCKCGFAWRFGKMQLLKMFIYNLIGREYTYTCPQCLTKYNYRMVYHTVKEKEVK